MTRVQLLLIGSGLVLVNTIALADPPRDLSRLFPREADIFIQPSASKLQRLELPTDLLSECRPDLSDVRVFDVRGKEVAFLVDRSTGGELKGVLRQDIAVTPKQIEHNEDKDSGSPGTFKETYLVSVPQPVRSSGGWELVIDTPVPKFVCGLALSTGSEGEGRTVEEGSIFRLHNGATERKRIPLTGTIEAALKVALVNQDHFIEPRFSFVRTREFLEGPPARVALPIASTTKNEKFTLLEVERPSGIVPGAIRIATSTSSFDRVFEVHDLGPGARDVVIGHGSLFRSQAASTIEHLDLSVSPATGGRLRIVVNDLDSPALDGLELSAIIRQPALVFTLSPSSDPKVPAGTLRFGGGRAHLPEYDVASLLPPPGGVAEGKRADVAASLYSSAQLAKATLGALRQNPKFDSTPVLAFAMTAGATLDPRLYTHRRTVLLSPSQDGLSSVALAIEDLAVARPDVADVRFIDAQFHQWPFLLEAESKLTWVDCKPGTVETKAKKTTVPIALPQKPLALDGVAFTFQDAFFDRPFELTATNEKGDTIVLSRGQLRREADRPGRIDLSFDRTRISSLALTVDNGDAAALHLATALARVHLPVAYVAAPQGNYTLLVGNPDATAPVYDIATIRDVVLGVASAIVTPQDLQSNPQFSQRARLGQGHGPEQLLVWLAIGAAVLVLGGLTLRTARREPDENVPPKA